MRLKNMRRTALALTAVLFLTGTPVQIYAEPTEQTTQEMLPSEPAEQTTQETISDNTVSDNVISEGSVPAPSVPNLTISENAIEGSEGEFYRSLTSAELSAKTELKEDVAALGAYQEGIDYKRREVIYLCDTEEEAQAAAMAYNATVKSFQYGVAVLEIRESVLNAVTKSADQSNNLPAVYPNYRRYTCSMNTGNGGFSDPLTNLTDETLTKYQWFHESINDKFVWKAQESGTVNTPTDITVAVIDTGIYASHEDFDTITNPYYTYTTQGSGTYDDIGGHGTNVAGIIANTANSVGGRGVAAGVKIMPIRVFENANDGYDSAIIAAMNYVTEKAEEYNIRVVNLSLGSFVKSSAYYEPIWNMRAKGILVVAAAGNDNSTGDFYPAYYDGVVSVAALNAEDQKSSFSNYSSKVDLAAPGGEGKPDAASDEFYRNEQLYASGIESPDAYTGMQGTSQAAPVVSAVAALAIANHSEFTDRGDAHTADQIEELLENTSTRINTGYATGAGCVNAAAAVGIDAAVSMPTPEITSGTHITSGTQLALSLPDDQSDAVIYYTTNGKVPTPDDMDKTDTQIYTDEDKVMLAGKGSVTVKTLARLYGLTGQTATYQYQFDDSLVSTINVTSATGYQELGIGKKLKLQAEVLPAYAKNKKLTWTSSDTSLATVSASGEVSALAEGEVTITAKAVDGSQTGGSFQIEIKPLVKMITGKAEQNRIKLGVGETMDISSTFDVSPSTASRCVTYASSNPKVVTVDRAGLLTAVSTGSAKVTFTAADGSGAKDFHNVTVVSVADTIEITDSAGYNGTAVTLVPKVTFKQNGIIIKPDNPKLHWTITGGEDAASINEQSGVVTVNPEITYPEDVTIHAVLQENTDVTGEYTFTAYPVTTDIQEKEYPNILYAGAWYDFKADNINAVVPANCMGIFKYTSSNPQVVSIDAQTGQMMPIKPGKVTITMETLDGSGLSYWKKFTVYNALEKVAIVNQGKTNVLYPGKSITFGAVAAPVSEKLSSGYQFWTLADSETGNDYVKIEKVKGKAAAKVTAKAVARELSQNITYNINYSTFPANISE